MIDHRSTVAGSAGLIPLTLLLDCTNESLLSGNLQATCSRSLSLGKERVSLMDDGYNNRKNLF